MQFERLNKRKTFTTLGVLGGIIGTALLPDTAEALADCLDFDDLDDYVE